MAGVGSKDSDSRLRAILPVFESEEGAIARFGRRRARELLPNVCEQQVPLTLACLLA